jgi:protein-S-isoprenylcysteine O-methyltransferase Ste14
MLTVSFFLISGSLLVLIPWLHNALLLAGHARREENALTDKYGEGYVEYSRRTGMLFPRILEGALI